MEGGEREQAKGKRIKIALNFVIWKGSYLHTATLSQPALRHRSKLMTPKEIRLKTDGPCHGKDVSSARQGRATEMNWDML